MSEQDYHEDEIDLKELFLVLYRKRWLIIIITVLSFVFSSGFWFFKNKEEKHKVTWGIKTISLEMPRISLTQTFFPHTSFPEVFEKNFFSSNIEPVLKKFVRVKAYYKKTRVEEKQEEGSLRFERENIKSLELTGTKEAIDSALSHFVSRLIGITKNIFLDEISYHTSQIYLLNAQIEQLRTQVNNLTKQEEDLKKLKKEQGKTQTAPSIINITPELIPYLDIDTQLRGVKVQLNNLHVNIEDLSGLKKYHNTIIDYLKMVIPQIKETTSPSKTEKVYSERVICALLNNELENYNSSDPYIGRAYYEISAEINYLCEELKSLRVPLYVKGNSFSKVVIIITTFLGLFIAIFLAYFVELFSKDSWR